jgi:hypothetical protein
VQNGRLLCVFPLNFDVLDDGVVSDTAGLLVAFKGDWTVTLVFDLTGDAGEGRDVFVMFVVLVLTGDDA